MLEVSSLAVEGARWTLIGTGLGVLFGKLQQGVRENEQIVTIARMRADAEDLYGQHLGDILPATNRISDGFQRDEGASTKKVCTSSDCHVGNVKTHLCIM